MNNRPAPDILDDAIIAWRDQPVPAGPSAHLLRRTQSRLSDAGYGARAAAWRWAAVLLLCGTAAAATGWMVQHRSVSSIVIVAEEQKMPAPLVEVTIGLVGRVTIDGPPPIPRLLPLLGGPDCGHHHPPPVDESILVSAGGGLANVVVAVSSGLPDDVEYPHPSIPASLDQRDCHYVPRVVAMQVGQELLAKNSDPFLHNVHTNSRQNVPVNFAQPKVDPVGLRLKFIKTAETFKVTCDLHPWMMAWVAAFDHPYFAVTQADGSFKMPQLPVGTYTLRAWHERLGVVDQQVVVGDDGKMPPLRFTFSTDRLAAALADQFPTASAGAVLKPCCVLR